MLYGSTAHINWLCDGLELTEDMTGTFLICTFLLGAHELDAEMLPSCGGGGERELILLLISWVWMACLDAVYTDDKRWMREVSCH